MITINLNKAKDIHKEHLRTERLPLLESLDVQFMRAVEAGDTALQESIAQKKQVLRDATANPNIAAAQTVDQLKAVKLPII